jgi:hypothetical protein
LSVAPDKLVCFDAKYALHCVKTTYEIIPCKGPKGCHDGKTQAACDDNIAAEGDPCLPDGNEPNVACAPDHKAELLCKDKKFQLAKTCRGASGCAISAAGKVECDATLAHTGDACDQGSFACRVDHEMLLECKGGMFTPNSSCHGPKGCAVNATSHKAECDDSLANLGEPCDPANEERCSVDKKEVLRCTAGKYAKKKDCPKHGCAAKGTDLTCE